MATCRGNGNAAQMWAGMASCLNEGLVQVPPAGLARNACF